MTLVERDLADRVVLIAGASSGMGRASALAAATAGASVVLAARNAAALDEVAVAAGTAGASALAVPSDLTARADADRLASAAVARYGRIDIVINTIGTNIALRTLDQLTTESWAGMVSANLSTAFNLTQATVPHLRMSAGLIIYLSSSAAKRPDRSGIAYQATKTAVVGLAHGTMEEERQHGVRTTVIFPGLTDTPLLSKRPTPTPPDVLARALQPEDVAAACLFVMNLPRRAHVPELLLYPSQP